MFGVSQQQWSPWETGSRTPDEFRLAQLADFFGVTVEYLCQEHAENGAFARFGIPMDSDPGRDGDHGGPRQAASGACPFYRSSASEQSGRDDIQSLCCLAERVFGSARELNITFKVTSADVNHILNPLLSLAAPSGEPPSTASLPNP